MKLLLFHKMAILIIIAFIVLMLGAYSARTIEYIQQYEMEQKVTVGFGGVAILILIGVFFMSADPHVKKWTTVFMIVAAIITFGLLYM